MPTKNDLNLFHPNKTITRRMILSTSGVLLVLSVILSTIYWLLASSSFASLETRLMENQISSAQTQFNNAIRSAQTTMTQIVQLPSLRTVCESDDPTSSEMVACNTDLRQIVSASISATASSNGGNITFLNIYLKNGYSYSSGAVDALPFADYDSCFHFLSERTSRPLEPYISTIWCDVVTTRIYRLPVSSLVGIRFLYDRLSMEKVGAVAVGIRETSLREIFTAASGDAFLLHESGTVLSSFSPSESEKLLTEDMMERLLTGGSGTAEVTLSDGRSAKARRIGISPLWIIYPMRQTTDPTGRVFTDFFLQSLLLTVFAVTAAILIMRFFSRKLTKSLNELTGVVRTVQQGDISARFSSEGTDDIAYLGRQINKMLDDLQESFDERERDAAARRDLTVQLLQSQINPHLLYNTLNSVLGIIRQGDHKKAEKLILSLGSFFRLVLSRGNEMIPLTDELAMIRYYLEVQNLGREKAFRLETDVPDDLLSCRILRLTLQPFVENSVIHGFSDWRDDGVIKVSASRDAGDSSVLLLVLEDNGIGILPEDLSDMEETLRTYPPASENKHFGMYNVERRIRDKFGEDYGITMESEVGEYTRITIRMPLIHGT